MIIYGDTGDVDAVYSPSLGSRLMLSLYFLIPLRVLESSAIIPCLPLIPIIDVIEDFSYLKNRVILSKCRFGK